MNTTAATSSLQLFDVLLEAFSRFHLDGKVVVVPPQLLSGSILVVESLLYLFKVPERLT